MDIIGIAVIGAIAYVIYLGIKFTNFKSKLMNEFGRHGIPFEIADVLFTTERNDINALYHSGMPVDQIVNRYLGRAQSMGATGPFASVEPKEQYDSGKARELDSESDTIVYFVANSLCVQQALFLDESGALPAKALDEWSIGYVAGTADAVLQKNGFDVGIEGMSIMTTIFIKVFGEKIGPKLFRDFMRLQNQGNQAVAKGMMKGGQDVLRWMGDKKQIPTGWMAHIYDHDPV